MKVFLCTVIGIILFGGCTENNGGSLDDLIDDRLIEYFQSFEEEAALRGHYVDWATANISANLVDISTDAVGQCLKYAGGSRTINIDHSFWLSSDDMEREFLIFHELGHCFLGRSHLDDLKNDGSCLSMMNSGEGLCRKNYTLKTRNEYLDELFF